MNIRFLLIVAAVVLVLITILGAISEEKVTKSLPNSMKSFGVHVVKESWLDSSRMREIPVALFLPKKYMDSSVVNLVIFNHGYGANYPHNYTNYSYLTKRLAAAGYWVLSIQHELKTDSLLPKTGDVQVVRKPFWERGQQNILFALAQFKRSYPNVKINQLACVGHSNGGDMAVFTAKNYPDLFQTVITLDHLRVSVPLVSKTVFTTLRSSDHQADPSVLPEKNTPTVTVIQLNKIGHNDMNDEGSRKQHKTINKIVLNALRY